MKQRVNFYFDEFKPKLTLFTLNTVIGLWCLALLVILFFWWLGHQQWQQLSEEQENVASELRIMKDTLDQQNARQGQPPNPILNAEVLQLDRQLISKTQVLKQLAKLETKQSSGYGTLMEGLARQHHPDIWLSRIQVDEHGVLLQGGTLASTSIPKWLDGLKAEEYFRGMAFSTVQMQRDEQDRLMFQLSSRQASGGQQQGVAAR
ncbi:PilN domain-containing protein [Aliiglaciecola sp. CAU 1673]|uniref:PilN domain-containing protein n=1 Tax=Aliiglaciecola sp. CAU 1673 TaxID=3032595 RepID=UPI0023DC7297|nr:PilN domain-containing protein [Aliiglaciecola sp. CAU 1673]MDF2179144.1 PilN domain-containing protein [Aliiglaciecola sp. CAU 1673]